jgi:glycosyltransferase involved in cell wall biosynthesis
MMAGQRWRFRVPPMAQNVEPGRRPTFSVIIPAYQAARTIATAVASALEQTYPAHEIVICDDGSTDDLGSALVPFRDCIVLLQRPHRGAGAARNAAIHVASGEFIAMLDADDVYEPDRLKALAELATIRPDLDILTTDVYFEVGGRLAGRFYEFNEFEVQDQRMAILEHCFIVCPVIRRTRILQVGGFDESLEIAPAEDWELFVRLLLEGSKVGLVDQPLMRYRKHAAATTANRARALRSRVAVLEKTRFRRDLSFDERCFLARCLARARSRSVLNDAKALTAARGRGCRHRLVDLAGQRGLPAAVRLSVAAAAVAPGIAWRFLEWQDQRAARLPVRGSLFGHDPGRALNSNPPVQLP